MEFFRAVLSTVITEGVLPRVDPSRWALVSGAGGVVFGRRMGDRLERHLGFGAVAVLVLEPDGGYRLAWAPTSTEGLLVHADEAGVREHVARAGRRPYSPRGHAFLASPVFGTLCGLCARPVLDHERDHLVESLKEHMGLPWGADVQVDFADGTTDVTAVTVREPCARSAPENPVPRDLAKDPIGADDYAFPPRPAAPTRRSLNAAELVTLLRRVRGDDYASPLRAEGAAYGVVA
jgi:hypothetical protein